MQGPAPRISIVVPSFNAGPFLPALCASLQAQTFADFEVLIGDDASTDATREAIAPFLADDRFHYLRWETNRGVTQGTLMLLARARGEYWGYPGADDQYEPEFLAERLALLDAHPTVGIVHGPPTLMDEAGLEIATTPQNSPLWQLAWPKTEILPPDAALPLLLQHNVIGTPSVLVRSAATRAVFSAMHLPWRYSQDWSFWILHAAAGFDLAFDHRRLHRYRIVGASLTNDPTKAAIRLAETRLVPLWALRRAGEFSITACELWARWGRTLYALWLRRAWKLARANTLQDAWLQLGAQAYYGSSQGQVRLWRELARHATALVRSSVEERAARQHQHFVVSGLAQVDLPLFQAPSIRRPS